MPIPSLVAESGTLASGVVTVGGAVTGYRTFAAALTDGDSVDVVLRDASGAHGSYPASSWDETAGTLTLGTVDVASGSIADGAVTIWAASDVPMSAAEARAGTATTPRIIAPNILKTVSNVWWTDTPYSTDADWSPSINTQQIIDASTWTAPRTPTLPSGAVYGDRISFMLDACSLAGGVILTGNINGVVGEWWRLLVPGERIPLMYVGGSQWLVETDGRVKTVATIQGDGSSPNQSNGEAANAFFEVATMDDLTGISPAFIGYAGNSSVDDDGSTLTARRTCPVIVTGGWIGQVKPSANGWHQMLLENKTTSKSASAKRSFVANNDVGDSQVLIDTATIGDVYRIRVRSSTGNLGSNFYSGNFITIAEQ
jgi:hypothetical protein